MQTRTSKSIRNSMVAMLAQIMNVFLSFITRTVFIKMLGSDYLGVNGLFSNILSMLSLAEMGVGTAIIYALYKPISENDEKRISALMNLYAKVYKLIGIVIGILGLLLIPFLGYLIKDQPNIPSMTLIYLMFLANSVVSYFFTYKRSILIASQNGHINALNQIIFSVIQNIIQISILLNLRKYIPYLLVQFICTVCSNVAISIEADKLFPYLKLHTKEIVDDETKKNIGKNVVAMMSNKIGSVVVSGTDNLLISAFVGVYWVGLYSNYVLIIATIQNLIMQIINAITASVGNLIATESNEKSYNVFKNLFFINFLIAILSSMFLIILLNPFILLWIGEKYILESNIVSIIVINFFIIIMRQPAVIYINTYGLFWQIKWKSLFEAGINLVSSLILIIFFDAGVFGVLLGTTISNLLTNFWWEPYVVYKFRFKISLKNYLSLYMKYVASGIATFVIIKLLSDFITLEGFLGLISKAMLCVLISIIVISLFFYKSEEFKYFLNLLKVVLSNFKKKLVSYKK